MAKNKKKRIEPHFGAPPSNIIVEPPAPRKRKKTANRSTRSKPAAARRKRKASRKANPNGNLLWRATKKTMYWGMVLGIWAIVGVTAIVAYYGSKLPSADNWAVPKRPPNVKILDMRGQLIANRGATGGEAVGLHQMSPYIPQAVVAIEDHRFYHHFGFDPIGFTRAMAANLRARRMVQGGSTLTQQLAKNMFLKPDRTLERKVQEVLLALWLEHKFDKDQILEMYLNRVYFGSGAYGVDAASRRYFNKSARDVTLSEAALLAGLLKAPSRLSPARNPLAAERRSQLVLAAMRREGLISDSEMVSAIAKKPAKALARPTGSHQYVADRVIDEIPALIGDASEDIIVDSTIDMTLQKLGEHAISRQVREERVKRKVTQGALVSIDNTGAVRALVGGVDYAGSQFDRASEAKRQPGSTFKPFVYLAALERGNNPYSVRNDRPIKIGKWKPENYGGKYRGQVTLATALSRSLNSVAAQLAQEVGADAIIETANRLGIKSTLSPNISIALGTSEVSPLEMTAAYVPFANGGYRAPVHFIRRITTKSGKVLYENRYENSPRVIRPDIVAMMNFMMSKTVSEGTATKAKFGWPSAGKTGTSQNFRDAWFIGYTANLTTGVWFGNDDNSPMVRTTGGSLPAIAWREYMAGAHKGVPVAQLPGRWNPGTAGPQLTRKPTVSRNTPPTEVPQGPKKETTLLDILINGQ